MNNNNMEMMKKLIEEKKKKGLEKNSANRAHKSIGQKRNGRSNKNGGGLFDK
ncbi:hypothetical protein [Clostridium sp. 'White wine YQ']|uniref:hypothetical protein n=1 Tax=Clostridium sp. 'White wine YQ' TaxID=3027474 RepID=UPI0023663AC0|nr:hypothetical protein [Clostridium sp. 'White wine YQ']MDD7795694.1 hypothetical protein [Clostridium sp. 'White wine YQ']